MTKSSATHQMNSLCTPKNYRERMRILFPRKISNYFWYYVDHFSCRLEKFAKLYEEKSISNEYTREYTLVQIPEKSKILHVGCGAYPLTEITLAKLTNATIVGIDKNQGAVERANEIIQKKNLQKKIKICYGDGTNYSADKFDLIIISSCSTPKLQVIENIFHTARSDSIVIVRELDVAVTPIEHCIKLHKDIVLTNRIRHYPFPFRAPFGWQSFFLTKK